MVVFLVNAISVFPKGTIAARTACGKTIFLNMSEKLNPSERAASAWLVAQGADMIDVGGESTRPGATRVEADVERERVTPVVEALAQEGIMVSVDTMRASVAEA